MIILYKNKKINMPHVKKLSGIKNFTGGLMFCRREKARAILFEFKNPSTFNFTSFFVFFPFVIIWMDKNENILDINVVKPFKWYIPSKKTYFKVLEVPINHFYRRQISSLVGNQKSL
jgi:uncharacterized membrane protein (UPF0127 family)